MLIVIQHVNVLPLITTTLDLAIVTLNIVIMLFVLLILNAQQLLHNATHLQLVVAVVQLEHIIHRPQTLVSFKLYKVELVQMSLNAYQMHIVQIVLLVLVNALLDTFIRVVHVILHSPLEQVVMQHINVLQMQLVQM